MINKTIDTFEKSFLVARYTYSEVIQSRVVSNVFILGLVLMLISYVGAQFTFSVPQRVAMDLGLGLVSFSAVGIALFMGVTLLSKEIDQRTIYMVLAKPISRVSYLAGRILGLSFVLALNVALLSLMTLTVFIFVGGDFDVLFLWNVWFAFIESFIILNIVVLFSLLTNVTLSALYAFVVFVVGHGLEGTKELVFAKRNDLFVNILDTFSYIFPDLSLLNFKEFLLYEKTIPLETLLKSSTYGLAYSFIILSVTIYLFSKKDLN